MSPYPVNVRLLLDVARAMEAAGVAYVVAGGVAVVLHGHTRMTLDLDLALDLQRDNLEAGLQALTELGLTPRLPVAAAEFADPTSRERWVRDRHMIAFTMHDPADPRREVDVFATLPVDFEDLANRAVLNEIDGVSVPVVSVADLIAMKRAAGRAQDHADIDALEILHPDAGGRVTVDRSLHDDALDWSGTSDGPAALFARASLTLEQRLEWLDDCLNFAQATGALAADRVRRQAEADAWAESAGLIDRDQKPKELGGR